MMARNIFMLSVAIMVCNSVIADNGVEFSAVYKGDFTASVSGGKRGGTAFLGYAAMALTIDSGKLGIWKGGELYIEGASTHGDMPSHDLVGDVQGFDNIEAGNHTYMQQAWLRQQLGRVAFKVGLQDLNADYAVCGSACDFLNSSFGIHAVISCNFCAPIFPVTGLGMNINWQISDRCGMQIAVYDGNPIGFEDNPYNVRWHLSRAKGYLAITEGTYRRHGGIYKVGAYYHTAERKCGYYIGAEQQIVTLGKRDIDIFVQSACAPRHTHIYAGVGGGVRIGGVLCEGGTIGMGVSTVWIRDMANETVIEAYYRYVLNKNFYIQPDVQHIVDPSGKKAIKNVIVTTMRFGINF